MAEASGKVLEGVFAIKKPQRLSSAQVLRDLQVEFGKSKIFTPLLQETRRKQAEQARRRRKRRKRGTEDNAFKMGHGGTLDPLATGVLIVGLGRGTKSLNQFLLCTKTYDTVVLFGKSTDTYDVVGKVVAEAPYSHITRALVEEKLNHFRGPIKQVPPIYSALKINGLKAYEYARSGNELPRQLESRDMNVEECTLTEWYQAGEHDFRWPAEQAPAEDRAAAPKLMQVEASTVDVPNEDRSDTEPGDAGSSQAVDAADLAASPKQNKEGLNRLPPSSKAGLHTHDIPTLSDSPADAPAARFRLTSSSGFYVRSFAHDLGIACGSLGLLAELTRSRQSEYTIADPPPDGLIPCITYDELETGEDAWGPKLARILTAWMDENPVPDPSQRVDDRDDPEKRYRHRSDKRNHHRGGEKRKRSTEGGERRNSSSEDSR